LLVSVEQTPKRKKINIGSDKLSSKNITSQNSIDQKLNEAQKSNICKKLKLNHEKIVQKNEKEDKNISKSTVNKIKTVNGLKQNSSNCFDMLKVIKLEKNVRKIENYDVIKNDDKEVLLLNVKQTQMNSNKTAVLDKFIAVTHIIQDHNYQALQ
jgi:hypothetical protein